MQLLRCSTFVHEHLAGANITLNHTYMQVPQDMLPALYFTLSVPRHGSVTRAPHKLQQQQYDFMAVHGMLHKDAMQLSSACS